MRRARTGNGRLKKNIIIISAFFFTLLFAGILCLGFFDALFPQAGRDVQAEDELVEPVDKASGKINVLILGTDADGSRTDTIIVASYNLDDGVINMLSIPRDTRMYIGKRFQKINAAYSLTQNGKRKGESGTIEAVTRLTGIPINYYIKFSCSAFRNTIDALGGVDFYVPRRMKYSDPTQNLYIDLYEGQQHLDGDKAEQFVRFRYYPLGDIDRVTAQQNFLKALAEQKLNASILGKIPELYKTLQNDVETNFSIMDIMKYLPNLRELSSQNIHMYQLPGSFSGDEYDASYWLANISEIKTLVSETFGYDASNITTGANGITDPGDKKPKATAKPSAAPTTKPTSTVKPSAAPRATHTPAPTHTPSASPPHTPEPVRDIDESPAPTQTATPKPTHTPEPTSAPTADGGQITGKEE